jgi:hypothetical protein
LRAEREKVNEAASRSVRSGAMANTTPRTSPAGRAENRSATSASFERVTMTATAVAVAKPRVRVPAGGVAFPAGPAVAAGAAVGVPARRCRSPLLFRWHPALRETSDDVRQAWRLATARTVDQFQNSGWLSGAADISTAHVVGPKGCSCR